MYKTVIAKLSKRQRDYLTAIRDVMTTDCGKKLFKYLEESYVTTSSFNPNSIEDTIYNLAQKELVQRLISDSSVDPMVLEGVKTISYDDELDEVYQ